MCEKLLERFKLNPELKSYGWANLMLKQTENILLVYFGCLPLPETEQNRFQWIGEVTFLPWFSHLYVTYLNRYKLYRSIDAMFGGVLKCNFV